jgi:Flp pilus assembly pilin Flp
MEGDMFRVFMAILKNQDGFMAIEYGLIAAFTLVIVSQFASKFNVILLR